MTTGNSLKIVERRNFTDIVRIFFRFLLNDSINAWILLLKKNKTYKFDERKYKQLTKQGLQFEI